MAPLTQGLRTTFVEERGPVRVYAGEVDKDWTVRAITHGGYALGLIVSSCVSAQAPGHSEIAHVTGYYLSAVIPDRFEIHIRTIRIGKSYSNLAAELLQKNKVKISAQLIFKAPSTSQGISPLTILPPSPYARRVPLHMHPSTAKPTPMFGDTHFTTHVRWAEDQIIRQRNYALGRGEGPTVGGGVLEWGAWIELLDPMENINEAVLPWAGDMMRNLPELLPKDQRPPPSWHATLVLSLEYKSKIPDDPAFSKRTLGLYSSARFMHNGQHDAYVEIWTAPCAIGEGVLPVQDWRDKQVCLGMALQMAVTVPQAVNERQGARDSRL